MTRREEWDLHATFTMIDYTLLVTLVMRGQKLHIHSFPSVYNQIRIAGGRGNDAVQLAK